MTRAGIAIDIGGTKIISASSDDPETTKRWPTRVDKGADGVTAQLVAATRHWGVRPGERIVVASAGYLDVGAGVVVHASNLPFLDYPLADRLGALVGGRVEVIGDATAATVAELTHLSRRGSRNGLYVTVSTGIGMGAVRDGRLDWLSGNGERELGHQQVVSGADAEACGCGRLGCLEAYSSGSGIVRRYKRALDRDGDSPAAASDITVGRIVAAAERGDEHARTVVDEALRHLSSAIAQVTRELKASILVLGGGVIVHAGLFEPLSRRIVRELTPAHPVRVERSIFGDHSVIYGAASLCERTAAAREILGGSWNA